VSFSLPNSPVKRIADCKNWNPDKSNVFLIGILMNTFGFVMDLNPSKKMDLPHVLSPGASELHRHA
jgi:hypothetical protein